MASDGCVTVTLCLFSRCLTVVGDKLSFWRGLRMGLDTTGWFFFSFFLPHWKAHEKKCLHVENRAFPSWLEVFGKGNIEGWLEISRQTERKSNWLLHRFFYFKRFIFSKRAFKWGGAEGEDLPSGMDVLWGVKKLNFPVPGLSVDILVGTTAPACAS